MIENMPNKLNIVIYGAGAIGMTLAAWMINNGNNVSILTRPEKAQRLQDQAITIINGKQRLVDGIKLKVIDRLNPLQRVLTRITYEGVKTLTAAGFNEPTTSPLPPWWVILSSVYIPLFFTRSIFRRKIALIGSTSMASDILTKGSGVSELHSINGYLLELASQYKVDVPYSKKLYQLCQQKFSAQPFTPVTAQQLSDFVTAAQGTKKGDIKI